MTRLVVSHPQPAVQKSDIMADSTSKLRGRVIVMRAHPDARDCVLRNHVIFRYIYPRAPKGVDPFETQVR